MKLRILYIDGDGPFGGASRSLFETVNVLRNIDNVEPYFFSTAGTASELYKKIAKDIVEVRGMPKFDNTRYGYYRGLRWLIILREIINFPFMLFGLFKAKKKWDKFDVIHVNEFVYIIPALFAKWLFKAPLAVHVRALARNDNSKRTQWINFIFKSKVDAIIAIDGNVRATLPASLPVFIINNSFTPKHGVTDSRIEEKIQNLRSESLKVGFVGNLHRSKGVFEIIEAAKILKNKEVNVDFLIVGGETTSTNKIKYWLLSKLGFAQNALKDMEAIVENENLSGFFHLLGPTLNISYIYEHLDVLLFPSHFDTPGRPVFEAGFFGVPSIVAVSNPMPDTFMDGITGIAIPRENPKKLADAILYFLNNPIELKNMGKNAKELAEKNFSPMMNAKKILGVYNEHCK